MVGLNDEGIMEILSRTRIEDFTGEREGLEQWESRLQWKQRRDLVKAQLKKVKEWGDEECMEHPTCETTVLLRRECGHCWQSLLDEVKEKFKL